MYNEYVEIKRKENNMNTFYYFEGSIFESVEDVKNATKNYSNKIYEEIETSKAFDEFEEEFEKCKNEGESDLDAIEWSK